MEPTLLIPKINPDKQSLSLHDKNDEVIEFKKRTKIKQIYIIVPSVIFAILLIILIPSFLFFTKAKKVYTNLKPIVTSSDFGDVNKIKSDITIVKSSVAELKSSYGLVTWMKIVPFIGGYVSDLGHGINASTKVLEAGEITLVTLDPFYLN